MKITMVALAGLLLASTAPAAVVFQDLGTNAPPTDVGGIPVTPFDLMAQAAVADFAVVTEIPGSPIAGTLTLNEGLEKRTVPGSWGSWSHGYAGPLFWTGTGSLTTRTLTLPPGATAFYLYVEPNVFNFFDVECTTDNGTSSGVISVNGSAGANGFAFYTTAGESIATITVSVDVDAGGFALAEFGIAGGGAGGGSILEIPTLSGAGLVAMMAGLGLVALLLIRRRTA